MTKSSDDAARARRKYFAIKGAIAKRKGGAKSKTSDESSDAAKARRRHFAIQASIAKRESADSGSPPRKASRQRKQRTPHCYRCKEDLDSTSDDVCFRCGWIRCPSCSACGCYYDG